MKPPYSSSRDFVFQPLLNGRLGAYVFQLGTASLLALNLIIGVTVFIFHPKVFETYGLHLINDFLFQDAYSVVGWLWGGGEGDPNALLKIGFFYDDEIFHLRDVSVILATMKTLEPFLCGGCVFALLLHSTAQRKKIIVSTVGLCGLLLLLFGICALLDWDLFFDTLHRILFRSESWLFPRTSYILVLFPANFWQSAVAICFTLIGIILALSLIWAARGRRTCDPV